MSCRRDTSPPPLRPPVQSFNWSLGGLLDKLTIHTGAPDNEARSGDKRDRVADDAAARRQRDRVDYDAQAQGLIEEADRLLAGDTATTEQLRSLSSRLVEFGREHEQELSRRNYRAVQDASRRVQAEERRRDEDATQMQLDDLTGDEEAKRRRRRRKQ